MMIFSLVLLAIAVVSGFFCLAVQEDVLQASLGCISALAIVLTLICAPWAIKLTLAAIPFGFERLYRLS